MTTPYIVDPNGPCWVVVASARYAVVVMSSSEEAEEVAKQYRAQGMEVTIYPEWDMVPETALLPAPPNTDTNQQPPPPPNDNTTE